MKFLEFHARLRSQYGAGQVNRAESASERVAAWLSNGFAVAAVFIGDKVISTHNDDGAARTAARMIVADGHNGKLAVRIKRITV